MIADVKKAKNVHVMNVIVTMIATVVTNVIVVMSVIVETIVNVIVKTAIAMMNVIATMIVIVAAEIVDCANEHSETKRNAADAVRNVLAASGFCEVIFVPNKRASP